jgi:hypothetical protein
MSDLAQKIRLAIWIVHGAVALALVILFGKTGAMAGWCIVPGVLIACASAAAIPGRSITCYAAFGALMGVAFWLGVSAINAGQYLELIPSLLLLTGVAWFLRDPRWASFIFTSVVIALCLGLTRLVYSARFEHPTSDVEHVVRSVITSVVILVVGWVYLGVGFLEVKLGQARRKKRKSRAIRTPVEPPML